jgi:hypothetical protein
MMASMAMRQTLPGCTVPSLDYQVVVLIDAWDHETGLIYPSDEGAPHLVRGDYLTGPDTRASFWPQLAAPYRGWRYDVVPTPVRIRLAGRQAYGLATAWNDETYSIKVHDPTQRISLDPARGLLPADSTLVEFDPDHYEPVDLLDWPPVPRPQAERVQADAPWELE